MTIKYNIDITINTIDQTLTRLTNQIYKLLPNREEGIDWVKPLETIMEELAGMNRLLRFKEEIFFSLLNKLEGLFILTKENDFFLFRRIIFDCLGLLNEIKMCIGKEI